MAGTSRRWRPKSRDPQAPIAEVGDEAVAMMVERAKASLHALRSSSTCGSAENSCTSATARGGPGSRTASMSWPSSPGSWFSDSEDARWLRGKDFGDDKDRVIERSTGEHTYFASDIAYAQNKRERGFDRMVYVLGADHARLHRPDARGLPGADDDPDRRSTAADHPVRPPSRPTGGPLSIDDGRGGGDRALGVIWCEEIGVDASRWFLAEPLARRGTDGLELTLATSGSAENPVCSCHARMRGSQRCYRKAGEARVEAALTRARRRVVGFARRSGEPTAGRVHG